jgi:hypothetical protein
MFDPEDKDEGENADTDAEIKSVRHASKERIRENMVNARRWPYPTRWRKDATITIATACGKLNEGNKEWTYKSQENELYARKRSDIFYKAIFQSKVA